MAMVAEIMARLHLDNSQFTRGMRQSHEEVQRFAQSGRAASSTASQLRSDYAATGQAAERMAAGQRSFTEEAGKSAQVVGGQLTGAMHAFAGAAGLAFGAMALWDTINVAARADEMTIALNALGKNAGLTKNEIEGQVHSIEKMGITTDVAQYTLQQFIKSNLDVSKASQLARVAQDAAVLSMQDSSTTLKWLIYGVQTYQTEIFRTQGLNINVGKSFEDYAKSVHKSADALTEHERQTAVLNAVLESGKSIAGAYLGAMESGSKQIRSFPRYIEEIQMAIGKMLLPAFNALVFGMKDIIEGFKTMVEEGGALHNALQVLAAVIGGPILAGLKILGALVGFINDNADAFAILADVVLARFIVKWAVAVAGWTKGKVEATAAAASARLHASAMNADTAAVEKNALAYRSAATAQRSYNTATLNGQQVRVPSMGPTLPAKYQVGELQNATLRSRVGTMLSSIFTPSNIMTAGATVAVTGLMDAWQQHNAAIQKAKEEAKAYVATLKDAIGSTNPGEIAAGLTKHTQGTEFQDMRDRLKKLNEERDKATHLRFDLSMSDGDKKRAIDQQKRLYSGDFGGFLKNSSIGEMFGWDDASEKADKLREKLKAVRKEIEDQKAAFKAGNDTVRQFANTYGTTAQHVRDVAKTMGIDMYAATEEQSKALAKNLQQMEATTVQARKMADAYAKFFDTENNTQQQQLEGINAVMDQIIGNTYDLPIAQSKWSKSIQDTQQQWKDLNEEIKKPVHAEYNKAGTNKADVDRRNAEMDAKWLKDNADAAKKLSDFRLGDPERAKDLATQFAAIGEAMRDSGGDFASWNQESAKMRLQALMLAQSIGMPKEEIDKLGKVLSDVNTQMLAGMDLHGLNKALREGTTDIKVTTSDMLSTIVKTFGDQHIQIDPKFWDHVDIGPMSQAQALKLWQDLRTSGQKDIPVQVKMQVVAAVQDSDTASQAYNFFKDQHLTVPVEVSAKIKALAPKDLLEFLHNNKKTLQEHDADFYVELKTKVKQKAGKGADVDWIVNHFQTLLDHGKLSAAIDAKTDKAEKKIKDWLKTETHGGHAGKQVAVNLVGLSDADKRLNHWLRAHGEESIKPHVLPNLKGATDRIATWLKKAADGHKKVNTTAAIEGAQAIIRAFTGKPAANPKQVNTRADMSGAQRALDAWNPTKTIRIVTTQVQGGVSVHGLNVDGSKDRDNNPWTKGALGMLAMAMGGVAGVDKRIHNSPVHALIGEAGPEMVLPLSRPEAMRSLLRNSGYARTVLAAAAKAIPMATGGIALPQARPHDLGVPYDGGFGTWGSAGRHGIQPYFDPYVDYGSLAGRNSVLNFARGGATNAVADGSNPQALQEYQKFANQYVTITDRLRKLSGSLSANKAIMTFGGDINSIQTVMERAQQFHDDYVKQVQDIGDATSVATAKVVAGWGQSGDSLQKTAAWVSNLGNNVHSYASVVNNVGGLASGRAAANMEEWANGIRALHNKGLPGSMLLELVNAGPSSLPTVRRMLSGNYDLKKIIASARSVDATMAQLVSDLGPGFGQGMTSGVANGIVDNSPAAQKAAADFVWLLIETMKKEMGIASPSKVTMDMIGAPMVQGIIAAFNKGMPTGGTLSMQETVDNVQIPANFGGRGTAAGVAPKVENHWHIGGLLVDRKSLDAVTDQQSWQMRTSGGR